MANKRGRKTDYQSYVKLYKDTAAKMAKKGYSMSDVMYTKIEWETVHRAETNDRLKDIKLGKRKTTGNINRDLVNEQRWEFSSAQARVLKKGILKGQKISLTEIRAGKSSITRETIEERFTELKLSEGKTQKEASKIIAQEFFGS
jgi:hypothetical protein